MRRALIVAGVVLLAAWLMFHPAVTPAICYGFTLHPVPHPWHPIPCGYPAFER